MEDWANALAECIEAENLAFGETILIRGKSLKASLGSSQQGEAFEVGGYLDTDTLNLVLPASELLQLSDPPDINEIIEIRNKGYRVQMRRTLEAGHGYELQVALVPQYIPERPTEPIYITPNIVTELGAWIIPARPTEVQSLAKPLAPSEVQTLQSPRIPYNLQVGIIPNAPSNLEAGKIPNAPSDIEIARSPDKPHQLQAETFLWTPAQTTTLAWYDAADADTVISNSHPVVRWEDKSGNAYHLTPDSTQSPETGHRKINHLNAIEFVPTDNLINTDINHDQTSSPLFMAFIINIDSPQDGGNTIFNGTGVTTKGHRLFLSELNTANSYQVMGGDYVNNMPGFYGTAIDSVDTMLILKVHGSNSRLRIDGTQTGSGNTGSVQMTQFELGVNEVNGRDFDGLMGEIVLFTNASDEEKIEGYLAHKWGLASNLPATHTYKTNPPLQ